MRLLRYFNDRRPRQTGASPDGNRLCLLFKATNAESGPLHRHVYSLGALGAIFALALNSLPASAADWYNITLDNDIFVGNDNG